MKSKGPLQGDKNSGEKAEYWKFKFMKFHFFMNIMHPDKTKQ